MTKKFSYADAVRLVGEKENKLAAALEKILGAALLGGVIGGVSDLLGWFGAKADFIRLSRELLIKLGDQRKGLSRYDRTARLQAAHAVIVVVAFVDALQELKLPVKLKDLDLDKDGQLQLMGLSSLFDGTWPLPSAHRSYDENVRAMSAQYVHAGREVLFLIKSHDAWKKLDRKTQEHVDRSLTEMEPLASRRYQELIRQLVGDYPELSAWLQVEHETRMTAGMARLEAELMSIRVGTDPDRRRRELVDRYRAILDRPIIDPDEVPAGLTLPCVRDAYIDPNYQVFENDPSSLPEVLSWWNELPTRSDLPRYFSGYLTSPQAIEYPLVVLGDPGSGKSLLTKVLAARLPAADFLVIRIELRTVAAQDHLLGQIEEGIHSALHEPVGFAQLSRSTGGALPVILLDGFDELLQATGVSQTDYLKNIKRFQNECKEAGRPIAVVVTSRIIVSHGINIPVGAHVLRIAPFTRSQVKGWLEVWNKSNSHHFAEHGLNHLRPDLVLVHRDLASQPLLLLMLALYDAVDNALQRDQQNIGKAALYERLLVQFSKRQVRKGASNLTAQDLSQDVEAELDRLSVVAFAMFHRGTQWVTENDLDNDLAELLDEQTTRRRQGMHTPLTAGGAVLGRFFFVHLAEATRDGQALRTYEFLHATFGEYLVARLVWRILVELKEVETTHPRRLADNYLDDSYLHALLSFTPLTSRRPVIDFLMELATSTTGDEEMERLIHKLFEVCAENHPRRRASYAPVIRSVPTRYAVYSLNLVLLAIIVNRKLEVRTLGIVSWPRQTAFWKSQLSVAEWYSLIRSVRVQWSDSATFIASIGESSPTAVERLPETVSLYDAARESSFTADPTSNVFRYAFDALPSERFDTVYARALLELNASPVDPAVREWSYLRWAREFPDLVLDRLRRDPLVSVKTLRALSATGLAKSSGFMVQLCDRIGRCGPDPELLDLFANLWVDNTRGNYDVALLDAWLRLHELRHVYPSNHHYPDLKQVLSYVDFKAINEIRPDLVYRAGTAANEIGLFDDEKDY